MDLVREDSIPMPTPGDERATSLPSDKAQSPAEAAGIPQEWWDDFEASSRRSLETRIRYSFIKTYRPVMDDARFRAFDTMEEYRRWCEENLPEWLGYGRI
jgi:hypothetical protein